MYNIIIRLVAIHGRSLAVRQAARDDNDDLHIMRCTEHRRTHGAMQNVIVVFKNTPTK